MRICPGERGIFGPAAQLHPDRLHLNLLLELPFVRVSRSVLGSHTTDVLSETLGALNRSGGKQPIHLKVLEVQRRGYQSRW